MVYAALVALLLSPLDDVLGSDRTSHGQEPEIWRIRVSWGGGAPRPLRGKISIDSGTIAVSRHLGVQPWSTTTAYSENDHVVHFQTPTTDFEGFEVEIRADDCEELRLECCLNSSDRPESRQERKDADVVESHQFSLQSIQSKPRTIHLDNTGNRIVIERTTSDILRVDVGRPHLVFVPGEEWSPHLLPVRTGLLSGDARLNIEVVSDANRKIWRTESRNVTLNDAGSMEPIAIGPIHVPDKEGVYTLRVQMETRRKNDSLAVRDSSIERSVQFVVVETLSKRESLNDWKAIDLTRSEVDRERNTAKLFPRRDIRRKWFGHPPSDVASPTLRSPENPLEIAPSGYEWLALGNLHANEPHLVVVRAPLDRSHRIVLSVLEPDATGAVRPLNVDTGMLIEPSLMHKSIDSPTGEHRWIFWPRSDRSTLLIHNLDRFHSAMIQRIEILAGPVSLPPWTAEAPHRFNVSPSFEMTNDRRLVAVHFDRPFFWKFFGAAEVRDASGNRCFEDWTTYLTAANRFASYCHWAGYNGAILSIASEGGALFPSTSLRPTPRFDRGVFHSDGRDPIPKDVVELLMRVFEREGLRLVLEVDLNSPIAELEEAIREGETNLFQSRLWPEEAQLHAEQRIPRRMYNPLHPRFQQLALRLFDELNERYAKHAAWAGVWLRLGPQSHFSFAGDAWGDDAEQLQRYLEHAATRTSAISGSEVLGNRQERMRWRAWRAAELTSFYAELAQRMAGNGRKLFLSTSSCFDQQPSSEYFVDPVAASEDPLIVLAGHGISLDAMSKYPDLIPLRGKTWRPLQSISESQWSWNTSLNRRLDAAFSLLPLSGAQIVQQPTAIRVVMNGTGPFPENKWEPWLYPQMQYVGNQARSRLARRIAGDDCLVLADGGWQATVGQEFQCRQLLQTWMRLPPVKFSRVAALEDEETSSLVLRIGTYRGASYLLLVNQAPWKEKASFQWDGPAPKQWSQWIGDRTVPSKDEPLSAIEVPPFDAVVFQFEKSSPKLVSWRHQAETQVKASLTKALDAIESKVKILAQPIPRRQDVENGGFEDAGVDHHPTGWVISQIPTASIRVDREVMRRGSASLMIENRGSTPTWVQSTGLHWPSQNRIAVGMWIKTDAASPTEQVSLRIGIRGSSGPSERFERDLQITVDQAQSDSPWRFLFVPFIFDEVQGHGENINLTMDLLSTGRIWIDDLHLYDCFLTEEERRSIRSGLFLAKSELDQGHLFACQRFLDGYWANFVTRLADSTSESISTKTETVNEPKEGDRGAVGEDKPAHNEQEVAKEMAPMVRSAGRNTR